MKIFIFLIIGFQGKYIWWWAVKLCFFWHIFFLFFSKVDAMVTVGKLCAELIYFKGFPHPPLPYYSSLIAFVSKNFLGRQLFVTCPWCTICSQKMKPVKNASFPEEKEKRVWEETRDLHECKHMLAYTGFPDRGHGSQREQQLRDSLTNCFMNFPSLLRANIDAPHLRYKRQANVMLPPESGFVKWWVHYLVYLQKQWWRVLLTGP